MGRYGDLPEGQRRAVLDGKGVTDPALRRAIAARAAELAGGSPTGVESIPPDLRRSVDLAAQHAWRITDEDVAALRKAGYSEDALFEIFISAAVGDGIERLERGLSALRGGGR